MLHRLANAALFALVIFTTACAVPLGPGFHTEKELLEVRFVPGSPTHLEVRASFTLNNSGKVPLDVIDFSLPAEKYFGRSHLLITVDGASVSPQPLAAPAPSLSTPDTQHPAPFFALRIPLAAPWPRKSKRTVVISYQLVSSADSAERFGLDASSFFLSDGGWYPIPRAPEGLFAKGDAFPKQFDFSVFVPQDFHVHAAGQPRGNKRRAAESEFRFRIREADFSPFVVAGRYHQQKFSDSNGSVLFWTFQPIPAGQVTRAGALVASAEKAYEAAFGPRSKMHNPIWVAEAGAYPCFDQAFPRAPKSSTIDAPETVLLCSPTKLGNSPEAADFSFADYSLAATWFEHVASPQPDLPLPLLPGLLEYARAVAENNRGNAAFRNAIISTHLAAEKNGLASSKSALFLMALEDEVGKETLRRALRHMIQGLRGRTYSYTDLRVSLEAESGKDLGEFFRAWLNQPGIPAAFRQKYANIENRK